MPGDGSAIIDIQFAYSDPGVPGETEIRDSVLAALEGAGQDAAVEIAVRVAGRDEIRALNHEYRGLDKPTNVLSFAAQMPVGLPGEGSRPLGDIVVCAPVLEEEARLQQKSLADHWAHILTHGTLHLLGYDHENEEQAIVMETLETQILAERGIADPYRAR